MQVHYTDTDSSALSLKPDDVFLLNLLGYNKDDFIFSDLDNKYEFYEPINETL